MDFDQLDDETASAASLGEWHCDEALWREFRESEMRPYYGSLRAANHLAIGTVVMTFVILLGIALTTAWRYFRWQRTLGVAIVVLVISNAPLIAGLLTGIRRRQREAVLRSSTGDVVVGLYGFDYNGFRVEWNFGVGPMQFQTCERLTVPGRLGSSFEILSIYCDGTVWTGRGHMSQNWTWHVPIPAESIAVADVIVDRLNAQRRSVA